ncbi:hypothetical protein D3C84_1304010 [compost metagenome]
MGDGQPGPLENSFHFLLEEVWVHIATTGDIRQLRERQIALLVDLHLDGFGDG